MFSSSNELDSCILYGFVVHCIIRAMAAIAFYQPAGLHGWGIDVPAPGSSRMFCKFLSVRFACNASHHKLHPVHASISHASVVGPTSHSISHDSSSKELFYLQHLVFN